MFRFAAGADSIGPSRTSDPPSILEPGTAMDDTLCRSLRWSTRIVFSLLVTALGAGQEPAARPGRVVIKEGKLVAPEAAIDPTPRVTSGTGGGLYFGLSVDGTRITCTPNISVMPMARIDGQLVQPGFDPMTG